MKKILFCIITLILIGISTVNVYAMEKESITTDVCAKVKMFDKTNIYEGEKKGNNYIFKTSSKKEITINYSKKNKKIY